jgi:hypothetical protein
MKIEKENLDLDKSYWWVLYTELGEDHIWSNAITMSSDVFDIVEFKNKVKKLGIGNPNLIDFKSISKKQYLALGSKKLNY